MRPLRLFVQAFGPYREPVEINFTEFNEAGLFLITGPTGGGKTSLLDAISFALYCKATGGRRDFAGMRCMSAGEDTPTQVEFDFSLQGACYRFRRQRFFRQNRRTKELQAQESHECFTLTDGEEHLLESRSEAAVRNKAQELLHLTCEQFSQVAVLPQGEFLRLLRAGSQEKGEILRTLFSAEIWKGVRDRFQERAKELEEEARRVANMQLTLLRQAGAETPAALEEAIARQQEGLTALSEEAKKVTQAHEKAGGLLKAREAFAQLQDGWDRALAACQNAQNRVDQLEKERPHSEEKRQAAANCREQAVALAQEGARLSEQLERARQQDKARQQAAAARKACAQQEGQAARLGEELAQLAQRLEKGRAFEEQSQKATQRLPGLTERRAACEAKLSALEELERRRGAWLEAEKALAAAEKAAGEADIAARTLTRRLEEQDALRRRNAALELSLHLREGEACPVCGATDHPAPAQGEGYALDRRELENLRNSEKKARANAQATAAAWQAGESSLVRARQAFDQQAAACGPAPPTVEETRAALAKAKEEEEAARRDAKRLAAAQEKLGVLTRQQEELAARQAEARQEASAQGARAEALMRQAEEMGPSSPLDQLEKKAEEAARNRAALEKKAAQLQKEAEDAAAGLARAKEALSLAREGKEKARQALEAFPAPWQELPDLPALQQEERALNQREKEIIGEQGQLIAGLRGMRSAWGQVEECGEKLAVLEGNLARVGRLARCVRGDNPMKMPILQYVLSITLDQVLVSANRFFDTLSRGRYALRLMEAPKGGNAYGGLDLEVMDAASMQSRSIETLSGGEQFLASLALAFGLSDVVQSHSGAVELESIFIDEGFGSLDTETLDTAMRGLGMLRTGGRLIGVISHVSELQSRIPARIQVTRDAQGFSHAAVRL